MSSIKFPCEVYHVNEDIRKKCRNYKIEELGKKYYIKKKYNVIDLHTNKLAANENLKTHKSILKQLITEKGGFFDLLVFKNKKDIFKKNDRWFFAEVKCFHDKLSKNQIDWLKKNKNFLKNNIKILYIFPKKWVQEF